MSPTTLHDPNSHPTDPAPLVSIVIVNWNGWADTVECVNSCLALEYDSFRIVVVDNGSSDGSEGVLRERFPDIELLQTGANLGFSGGNNAGIRYALDGGADFVWLVNNDTVVAPAALSHLVAAARRDRDVGMVGSKIPFFDEPTRLWYAGAYLDPNRPYRAGHRGHGEEDRGQYDEAGETGYITGCSLLVRRETIEEIGLLEEGYFLYFEDADWNARARQKGWKLMYEPASVVLHKVSVSLGGAESPRMRYYLARNQLYFVRRNYPSAFSRAFGFDLFENVIVLMKKGRWDAARWALRGILDFLRGRLGPLR